MNIKDLSKVAGLVAEWENTKRTLEALRNAPLSVSVTVQCVMSKDGGSVKIPFIAKADGTLNIDIAPMLRANIERIENELLNLNATL